MNANKQDAGWLPNELGFEQWYVTNTFDYQSNPLGSRDCSIARKAWHAALEAVRNGEQCRAALVELTDEVIAAVRAAHSVDRVSNGELMDSIAGKHYGDKLLRGIITTALRALSRGVPEGK